MRIYEKSSFTKKVLAATAPYKDKDAEFTPLFLDVEEKNMSFEKALHKLSVDCLARLMNEESVYGSGINNLRDYAQLCVTSKNPELSSAGQIILENFDKIGWDASTRNNAEEPIVVGAILGEVENNDKLKDAITMIRGEEFIAEIKEGHAQFTHAEAQRIAVQEKVDAKDANRELGLALDRMFRYINYQIEFKGNVAYATLANSVNNIIGEVCSNVRLRDNRIPQLKNKAKKCFGITFRIKFDFNSD
jgi:hypothetical protein